jgi:hypothetical protein
MFRLLIAFLAVLFLNSLSGSTWQTPIPISNQGFGSISIAEDGSGNGVVVWVENAFNLPTVLGANLPFGASSWQNTTDLGGDCFTNTSSCSTAALFPNISSNTAGEAIVVWDLENISTVLFSEQSAKFTPTTSWTDFQNIPNSFPPSSNSPGFPQVAVMPNGNAIAVWVDNLTSDTVIASALFSNGTWTPLTFPSGSFLEISFPRISIDGNGKAVAVWQGGTFGNTSAMAAIYNGTSWSLSPSFPSYVSTDPSAILLPVVTMNEAGEAMAVWQNLSSGNYSVVSAFFDGSSWVEIPFPVVSSTLSPSPQVSMDSNGDAVAVWGTDMSNTVSYRGQAATYDHITKTWTLSAAFPSTSNLVAPTSGVPNLPNLNVIMDPNGDAAAVWVEASSATEYRVQGATFPLGGDWSSSTNISTISATTAPQAFGTTSLASNSKGTILAAWGVLKNGGDVNVAIFQSSSYQFALAPLPPDHFRGKVIQNNFLLQSECIHQLKWSMSPDPTVTKYKIFRGKKLIAVMPASGPFTLEIPGVNCGVKTTYKIVAVNANGNESTARKITL